MNLMKLFPFRRKKERQDYMRRVEEFDKRERETEEERYKRRTQPSKPAMTLNEIMTKRGETPSEITQKFAKWVKEEILNDNEACGMEIRVAACNWPDYDYVPQNVPTVYTLCYRGNGSSPVEKNTFMEVMGAREKEVKCKFIKDLLREIKKMWFVEFMLLSVGVLSLLFTPEAWQTIKTRQI